MAKPARHKSFGPWATAFDAHPGAALDTFWQRRMAMLAQLSRSSARMSRGVQILLIALGLAALAAPWVYLTRSLPARSGDDKGTATSEPAAPTAEFLPPLSESEKKITAELEKPTSIEFSESPLSTVVDYLKDLHNIEIQLDAKPMEDSGIDGEVKVTCTLKGTSLRSALRHLLSKLDMTYLVDDDMLLLTTNEAAAGRLVTRTYPVGDLVSDGKTSSLISAITDTIKPVTWQDEGGEGRIAGVDRARSLVISQNHEVHDEVLKLLRSLRAARKAAGPISDTPETAEPPRAARPKGGGIGKGGMGGGMF